MAGIRRTIRFLEKMECTILSGHRRVPPFGLAGGEAGVSRALAIVRKEADTTMALMGERDIRNIGAHNIYANDLERRQGY